MKRAIPAFSLTCEMVLSKKRKHSGRALQFLMEEEADKCVLAPGDDIRVIAGSTPEGCGFSFAVTVPDWRASVDCITRTCQISSRGNTTACGAPGTGNGVLPSARGTTPGCRAPGTGNGV